MVMFVWLQRSGAAPRRRPVEEQGRPVRVLELASVEVVPRTFGYGAVEAQRDWQALTEVSGVVVEVADRLEVGRVVREGTVLLKIDPAGYELERSKSESTAKAVRAQIAEIEVRRRSAAANLKIEERALELAETDLERVRRLAEDGNAPLTEVEATERTVLMAQKAVQGYRNSLAELPVSRRVLEAQLEQQEAGVQTTRIDVAKTEIVAPFTMRLREVNVAAQQLVSAGQVLIIGDGVDVFEIPAQVPFGSLEPLLPPRPATPRPDAKAGDPPRVSRMSAVEAIVRLESQGVTATWKGTLRRFGGIDPTTRTMIAVVQVEDERVAGSSRTRLNRGLYVEVELRGPAKPDCLAVPTSAFHDGRVYVVDAEDRLSPRDAETTLVQEDLVCLAPGTVAAGERIVLTELVPAVAGMLLAPKLDEEAAVALAQLARAETPSP
jgi:multidrug resistance efflux pump